jgi:hypothetical protein
MQKSRLGQVRDITRKRKKGNEKEGRGDKIGE